MAMKVENNLSCPAELERSLETGAKLGLGERDFRAEALLQEYRTNGKWPSYEESLDMQGARMRIHHANEAALCESIKALSPEQLPNAAQVKELEAQVGAAPRTWGGYGSRTPNYLAEMLADPKKAEALEGLTKHLLSSSTVEQYAERVQALSPDVKETLNEYLHQRLFPGELKLTYPSGDTMLANYIEAPLYKAASSMFSQNGLDEKGSNAVIKAINPSARYYESRPSA